MGQIEIAKQIADWRNQGIYWSEIGHYLDCHPDKARSILRRYQSDLDGEIDILSILDKKPNYDLFGYRDAENIIDGIDIVEQSYGYGKYLGIGDIHGDFLNRESLKIAIGEAKNEKVDTCIIPGDLFNLDSASKFPVKRDDLIKTEMEVVEDILHVLATMFNKVIVIEGNHDARLSKLLASKIPNGLKDFFKGIHPIQKVIDTLKEKESIDNIKFTYCNYLTLGNVLFAHPDHYSSTPAKTVCDIIDSYLPTMRNLSGVVIGHTHINCKMMYKGVGAFELGCMCYEPDYRKGIKKRSNLWTTSYGIISITECGNLDYNNSHVIKVGGN